MLNVGENPLLEMIAGKGGDGATKRMRTIRAAGPSDMGFLVLGMTNLRESSPPTPQEYLFL